MPWSAGPPARHRRVSLDRVAGVAPRWARGLRIAPASALLGSTLGPVPAALGGQLLCVGRHLSGKAASSLRIRSRSGDSGGARARQLSRLATDPSRCLFRRTWWPPVASVGESHGGWP